eukprot:scaffold87617_cov61-Attheya_sp.AAC.6
MYKNTKVIINIGKETREIIYRVRVKQGDNMAPVLFIFLVNAFTETLENKWDFKKMEYKNWFPKAKNGGIKRGRLVNQGAPRQKD